MNMDPNAFRRPPDQGAPLAKRSREPFLRGPIPLSRLLKARNLPGESPLVLFLALHFQARLTGATEDVRLTRKLLSRFELKTRTACDALKQLESAGLVTVKRPPGQCRLVTIVSDNG